MLVAMIVWGVAMWYLIRLVGFSSTHRSAPCRAVLSPLTPTEVEAEADPGEALEADLVLARLAGLVDVTTYQEAMAALAASTPSHLPGARRPGR